MEKKITPLDHSSPRQNGRTQNGNSAPQAQTSSEESPDYFCPDLFSPVTSVTPVKSVGHSGPSHRDAQIRHHKRRRVEARRADPHQMTLQSMELSLRRTEAAVAAMEGRVLKTLEDTLDATLRSELRAMEERLKWHVKSIVVDAVEHLGSLTHQQLTDHFCDQHKRDQAKWKRMEELTAWPTGGMTSASRASAATSSANSVDPRRISSLTHALSKATISVHNPVPVPASTSAHAHAYTPAPVTVRARNHPPLDCNGVCPILECAANILPASMTRAPPQASRAALQPRHPLGQPPQLNQPPQKPHRRPEYSNPVVNTTIVIPCSLATDTTDKGIRALPRNDPLPPPSQLDWKAVQRAPIPAPNTSQQPHSQSNWTVHPRPAPSPSRNPDRNLNGRQPSFRKSSSQSSNANALHLSTLEAVVEPTDWDKRPANERIIMKDIEDLKMLDVVLGYNHIDVTDSQGNTALYRAAQKCRPAVVKYLLQRGAVVNMTNKEGSTPLHAACASDPSGNITNMLMEASASTEIRDKQGRTPLHVARAHGNYYAILQLQQAKTDLARTRTEEWVNQSDSERQLGH